MIKAVQTATIVQQQRSPTESGLIRPLTLLARVVQNCLGLRLSGSERCWPGVYLAIEPTEHKWGRVWSITYHSIDPWLYILLPLELMRNVMPCWPTRFWLMMSCSLIAKLLVAKATKNLGMKVGVVMIGLLCNNWPIWISDRVYTMPWISGRNLGPKLTFSHCTQVWGYVPRQCTTPFCLSLISKLCVSNHWTGMCDRMMEWKWNGTVNVRSCT